ncbi:variable surface protein [Plasmodium gonderi]|uniref:Variable surface protein n=1 Tax=Plasmodium gonderi TaxID=77519 RepID=A0A1Y1JRY0_PLAGO|nr:variable surface protein [Plasmodium gonderi]GAW83957.1 variable surface protein [Plasmodium gonderi]
MAINDVHLHCHYIHHTIYELVKSFPDYKKIMDLFEDKVDPLYIDKCNNVDIDVYGTFKSKIKNKCPQVISYLYNVYEQNNKNIPEVYCKYLSYWIYHDLLNKKYVNGITILYHSLIDVFKSIYKDVNVDILKRMYISDTTLANITSLYDIYTCLGIINDNRGYKYDKNFCNAIKAIQDKNKAEMEARFSALRDQNVVHTCKNKIPFSIIITLFIMFLTTLLLFIVYKFTPYGSYLSHEIKKIKKKWKNIHEASIIRESSEIPQYNLNDKCYDILYHCD